MVTHIREYTKHDLIKMAEKHETSEWKPKVCIANLDNILSFVKESFARLDEIEDGVLESRIKREDIKNFDLLKFEYKRRENILLCKLSDTRLLFDDYRRAFR